LIVLMSGTPMDHHRNNFRLVVAKGGVT